MAYPVTFISVGGLSKNVVKGLQRVNNLNTVLLMMMAVVVKVIIAMTRRKARKTTIQYWHRWPEIDRLFASVITLTFYASAQSENTVRCREQSPCTVYVCRRQHPKHSLDRG